MCSLYCVGRWGWGHGKLGCCQFHFFFNDRENPSNFPAASSCVLVGSEHVCEGSRNCLRPRTMFHSCSDRDTCWWLPPAIQACVREGGERREVGDWPGHFPSLISHGSPVRLVQPKFSPRE